MSQRPELKLNLGCGKKHLPGYVNIDLPGHQVPPDLPCDIRYLPFAEGVVDEILAIHVFEHFTRAHALDALARWTKLLRSGGMLALELPCLDKILLHFNSFVTDPVMTTWGLYGDPERIASEGEQQCHRWCWSAQELKEEMERVGLINVRLDRVQFHKPQRDMRLVGFRP